MGFLVAASCFVRVAEHRTEGASSAPCAGLGPLVETPGAWLRVEDYTVLSDVFLKRFQL